MWQTVPSDDFAGRVGPDTRWLEAGLKAVNSSRQHDEDDALLDQQVAEESDGLQPSGPHWPVPPRDDAYRGLAGEFVRLVEPHSEADPVALLSQFLMAFGNAVGRGPYFTAEADRHYTNLFMCLVGETSKGRKGSAWGQVLLPLARLDPTWVRDRIQKGLSSGEGLIWAVRDPISVPERVKGGTQYESVVTDPGVSDKRLQVFEAEFASVLKVLDREGNTLSALLRGAWDSGDLRTLTKNSPARATGAHVSLVAHVTRDELRRHLDRTEMGNGFANRFLWFCVRRSKLLPEGGNLQTDDLDDLVFRIAGALETARSLANCELRRDQQARQLWFEEYERLSQGRPGLLGSVTSRAEAQVMRLACIYALLDSAQTIRREHLESGLALWRYADASARYIFGDSLGDPVADLLLASLRSRGTGLTRTEISSLIFGRHTPAPEIQRALADLEARGLLRRSTEETAGRPAERWVALSAN